MRPPYLVATLGLSVAIALGCGGGSSDGTDYGSVASSSRSVEYTQWSMQFSLGDDEYYTVDFLGDGTWLSDGESGNTYALSGDQITMADSDGYTYDAKFVDDWTIGGTVTQPGDGETWPFRMTRIK